MKVRAILKLRNEPMLRQREKLWLSQIALAEIASVPLSFVLKLERLDFSPCFEFDQKLARIAGVLELNPEQIVPTEVLGEKFTSRFVAIKDCDPNVLAASENLSSEKKERAILDGISNVLHTLQPRRREVIEMTYGLNGKHNSSNELIGEIMGISPGRVLQIRDHAIRNLQHPVRVKILSRAMERAMELNQ